MKTIRNILYLVHTPSSAFIPNIIDIDIYCEGVDDLFAVSKMTIVDFHVLFE